MTGTAAELSPCARSTTTRSAGEPAPITRGQRARRRAARRDVVRLDASVPRTAQRRGYARVAATPVRRCRLPTAAP